MGCRYAGVDWAAEKHDVLVADEAGEMLLATSFAHDERGLQALCRTLVRMGVMLVAIERPDGLLVERFWPGPRWLFSHMVSEFLLSFLERDPIPADARGLGVARMQAFLERERYSGKQQPAALITKLRSAPQGRVGELELAARRQL